MVVDLNKIDLDKIIILSDILQLNTSNLSDKIIIKAIIKNLKCPYCKNDLYLQSNIYGKIYREECENGIYLICRRFPSNPKENHEYKIVIGDIFNIEYLDLRYKKNINDFQYSMRIELEIRKAQDFEQYIRVYEKDIFLDFKILELKYTDKEVFSFRPLKIDKILNKVKTLLLYRK